MASIKKRGKNSYFITVSCGRNSNGKKIFRTVTYQPEFLTPKGNPKTKSTIEKEVAAYAAEFERLVLTGQYRDGRTMTLEEYSKKYLTEYAELNLAPRSLESTRSNIQLFVKSFGYMTLESLNPLFLQEYFNSQLKAKKTRGTGTISPTTVKRRAATLSAMLSQAVRWNLISSNPMMNIQIKKAKKKKLKNFTQEQAEIFLSLLDKPLVYSYGTRTRNNSIGNAYNIQEYQTHKSVGLQLKFFFTLAMFTGCRRGELIALTWDDINFSENTVTINKSACRVKGKTIIKEPKTEESNRVIAVPSVILNTAKELKKQQAAYRLSIGSQWAGTNNVFIKWDGSMMGLETPYQAFHRIINNYNEHREEGEPELPLIPLHGLRHTAATLLIGHGVDVRTVAGRLGHADTSTTLNIYAHVLEELDRSASDTLEQLLLPSAK